jgi:3-oxoacyl-[acyl-carrier-protein] synthase II
MTPEEREGKQAREIAPVDRWSPQPEISAMKARRLDRGSQFAVVAGLEAVRAAGYPVGEKKEALGIALGTGSAGAGALTEFIRILLTESPEAAPPFHFANTIANAPASQVSLELKFLGPNATITQKDPSSLNALIYAVGCLEEGRAEAMIAGGVDEWNPVYSLAMDQMRALRGEKLASGIVQGEGCYLLFLEREDSARLRGATALCRVGGYAFASTPSAPYRFAADDTAAERAMRGALERAGTPAEKVDLLFVSRNGRSEMDEAEKRAVARVFAGREIETVAVKDSIGEMAAAGGAQLVVAALRIAEPEGPRRALVNSFGAGGNFISAVLERA